MAYRYRAKLAEVTALQWLPADDNSVIFLQQALNDNHVHYEHSGEEGPTQVLLLRTSSGEYQPVQPADWIIRADDGTWSAMTAADFAQRYEPAGPYLPPEITMSDSPWQKRLYSDDEGALWINRYADDDELFVRLEVRLHQRFPDIETKSTLEKRVGLRPIAWCDWRNVASVRRE